MVVAQVLWKDLGVSGFFVEPTMVVFSVETPQRVSNYRSRRKRGALERRCGTKLGGCGGEDTGCDTTHATLDNTLFFRSVVCGLLWVPVGVFLWSFNFGVCDRMSSRSWWRVIKNTLVSPPEVFHHSFFVVGLSTPNVTECATKLSSRHMLRGLEPLLFFAILPTLLSTYGGYTVGW